MKHIVALSGGKDSTAMALELLEREPGNDYTYICTPTGDELPEMIDHWLKLEGLLGKRLTYLTSGNSLGSLIERWNALPNLAAAVVYSRAQDRAIRALPRREPSGHDLHRLPRRRSRRP